MKLMLHSPNPGTLPAYFPTFHVRSPAALIATPAF